MLSGTLTHPEDIRRVLSELLNEDNALVTLNAMLRRPELSSIDVSQKDVELARELDIRMSMHNRDGDGVDVIWDVAIYAKLPGEDSLPEVPEGRPALGTATATCDEVGDVMEASFPRPDEADGPITAVWSLDLDKQSDRTKSVLQGPWHEAFGLPDETTVIPRVTTKAAPTVMEGEQYGDTAHHDPQASMTSH